RDRDATPFARRELLARSRTVQTFYREQASGLRKRKLRHARLSLFSFEQSREPGSRFRRRSLSVWHQQESHDVGNALSQLQRRRIDAKTRDDRGSLFPRAVEHLILRSVRWLDFPPSMPTAMLKKIISTGKNVCRRATKARRLNDVRAATASSERSLKAKPGLGRAVWGSVSEVPTIVRIRAVRE